MSGLFDKLREWRNAPSNTASAHIDRAPADASPFTAPPIQEIGKQSSQTTLPRRSLDQLLAAVVLHYCQGEARFTAQFLEGLPPSLKIEAWVDLDGTLIVKARR